MGKDMGVSASLRCVLLMLGETVGDGALTFPIPGLSWGNPGVCTNRSLDECSYRILQVDLVKGCEAGSCMGNRVWVLSFARINPCDRLGSGFDWRSWWYQAR